MKEYSMDDITKLGLSEKGDMKLKRLQEENHFQDMRDAFRVGIALAIAFKVSPQEDSSKKIGRYNISQIDEDKSIETAINLLSETNGVPTYRWAERLAEWGVAKLSEESESGQINFTKLLEQAEALAKKD
jgi:hypothetical protein